MGAPACVPAGPSCSQWEAEAKPAYLTAISDVAGVQQNWVSMECQEEPAPGKRRFLLNSVYILLIRGRPCAP
jgi:hypothetical protein